MRLEKLKYAINKNGYPIHIDEAESGETYFLDNQKTISLATVRAHKREGRDVVKHFRRPQNADEVISYEYIKRNESEEHINLKREIVVNKGLVIDGVRIKAFSAKEEVYFPETRNILDVVLYDEYGRVQLGIEVCHSNRKEKDDIINLNRLSIPIYEKYTDNSPHEKADRFICLGASQEAIQQRIQKGREEISRLERKINDFSEIKQRVIITKQRISEVKEGKRRALGEKRWLEAEIGKIEAENSGD